MVSTDTRSESRSPFGSYREYLAALRNHDSSFKWLHSFFERKVEADERTSHATILDVDGEKVVSKTVSRETLRDRPRDMSTRIIVFSWRRLMGSIDKDILDEIAFALDLDPVFLWRHFYTLDETTPAPPVGLLGPGSLEITTGESYRWNSDRLSGLIFSSSNTKRLKSTT